MALLKIKAAFQSRMHVEVLAKVAARTHKRLVEATPKGYTGLTRQRWEILKTQRGYKVSNAYKVMRWLEYGTKAHGPKVKKALYIPLNRKAALGGWNDKLVYGRDYVLAKRVRGIKALRIVRWERRFVTPADMKAHMKAFVRQVIAG